MKNPFPLLLVDCYDGTILKEPLPPYRSWIETAAASLGVTPTLLECKDSGPFPEGYGSVILTGSEKMVGQREYAPELIAFLGKVKVPLLGVCYGHQLLANFFGARVYREERLHRGDERIDILDGNSLFRGISQGTSFFEHHSERVDPTPAADRLVPLAVSSEGLLESFQVKGLPFFGVQFHPEASKEQGVKVLVNFLSWGGE